LSRYSHTSPEGVSPHARCVPIAITPPRRRCRSLCPPCELKQPRQAHRRRSCSQCRLDASTARVVRECRAQVEDGRASSPVPPPPPSQLPSSCAVDGRVGKARKRSRAPAKFEQFLLPPGNNGAPASRNFLLLVGRGLKPLPPSSCPGGTLLCCLLATRYRFPFRRRPGSLSCHSTSGVDRPRQRQLFVLPSVRRLPPVPVGRRPRRLHDVRKQIVVTLRALCPATRFRAHGCPRTEASSRSSTTTTPWSRASVLSYNSHCTHARPE
jgi:hypothetical protein